MTSTELVFGFQPSTKAKFPWLFTTTPIDRHNSTRQVPMQVLSLGMGRTGTASMQKALQMLGLPTYHGFEMHANKPDNRMWIEAFDAKYQRTEERKQKPWKTEDWRRFFDALLGRVSAVTDLPCNVFGPELIAAYPEAKVVIVERDVDSWYKSWEKALIQSLEMPGLDWFKYLNPDLGDQLAVAREGVMKCQFGAATTDEYRENAKPTYKKHYAELRSLLKDQPDRLLEYKLGSGWEPLCEFVGKPVPGEPFPHVNESATHEEMGEVIMVMMARQAMGFFWLRIFPVVALLGAMYWQLVVRR